MPNDKITGTKRPPSRRDLGAAAMRRRIAALADHNGDVNVLATPAEKVAGEVVHTPDYWRADATVNGPRREARQGEIVPVENYDLGVFRLDDETNAAFLRVSGGAGTDRIVDWCGERGAILVADARFTSETLLNDGRRIVNSGRPGTEQPVDVLLLFPKTKSAVRSLAKALRALSTMIDTQAEILDDETEEENRPVAPA